MKFHLLILEAKVYYLIKLLVQREQSIQHMKPEPNDHQKLRIFLAMVSFHNHYQHMNELDRKVEPTIDSYQSKQVAKIYLSYHYQQAQLFIQTKRQVLGEQLIQLILLPIQYHLLQIEKDKYLSPAPCTWTA